MPTSSSEPAEAGQRRRRWNAPLAGFAGLFLVPFLLTALYYLLIATDRYVSEAKFTVRDSGAGEAAALDLGFLLGGSSVARQDAYVVREYILSSDLLERLDEQLSVRKAFTDSRIDLLTRLSSDASAEDFLEYYQDMIEVSFDSESSIITLKLEGFEPAFTRRMLGAVLAESESLVNEISNRLARDQLAFINNEISENLLRLKQAKSDLVAFQNRHRLVDPTAEAGLVGNVIAQMAISLAEDEAQLNALQTYLDAKAPEIVTLESKIDAKTKQIEIERTRLAGTGDARLNAIMAHYEDLKFDVEFASERYRLALLSLEKAQIDASQKVKSLVVVDRPNLPDEALYPDRPYLLATIGAFLLLIYGIVSVVVAAVREHMA